MRRLLLLFTGMLGLAVLELQAEGMPPRAELLQQVAHAHSAALRESVFAHDHWPNPPTPQIPVRAPGQSSKKPHGGGSWTDPDLQTLASGTSLPGLCISKEYRPTVHFLPTPIWPSVTPR